MTIKAGDVWTYCSWGLARQVLDACSSGVGAYASFFEDLYDEVRNSAALAAKVSTGTPSDHVKLGRYLNMDSNAKRHAALIANGPVIYVEPRPWSKAPRSRGHNRGEFAAVLYVYEQYDQSASEDLITPLNFVEALTQDVSGAQWEKMPTRTALVILPDVCGFQLGDEARNLGDGQAWDEEEPWSWNGDAESPQAHDLRITLAVESDERVLAEIDEVPSGARAREYFVDGGNAFTWALRSDAYLPTDDGTTGGNPVLDLPAAGGDAYFSGTSTVVDETGDLEDLLESRLQARSHAMIGGMLVLSGLQVGGELPFPVGYRVGDLQVSASGERQALDLNACIRAAQIEVRADRTTFRLDGR